MNAKIAKINSMRKFVGLQYMYIIKFYLNRKGYQKGRVTGNKAFIFWSYA